MNISQPNIFRSLDAEQFLDEHKDDLAYAGMGW